MTKKLLILLFIAYSSLLPAKTSAKSKIANAHNNSHGDSKIEAKAIMEGVYESFVKVIPYVYADEKNASLLVKDSAQKIELIKNLTDISEFFKSARHVEYFQRPGFRPSLETINHHLVDTIRSVKNDNLVFAQKRLKALTALCISCHSQLSETASQNAFGVAINKAKRETFDSDFAYANYLFLVRRFSDSEKYFDLAIDESLKNSINEPQKEIAEQDHTLYASMRKQISISTKINFNPKKGHAFIDKYLKDTRLPVLAKNTLETWEKALKKWDKFNPKKMKSVDSFIKFYLAPLETDKGQTAGGENDVTLLVASGVLSKYLNDQPKSKLAPEILYWLSIAERRLSNTYFFSLSDLYLKDCVKLYPKSRFAKKCYAEYAENIEFGYSGSAGTDIPAEEKQELERLKSYLK